MKRLGTMLVAIAALALVAGSSALAAKPNPWKTIGAPTNATWTGITPSNASWTGGKSWSVAPAGAKEWGSKAWDVRNPSQAKGWGDVRNGTRTWDVRNPAQAKGWGDVRNGTRTWDVRQAKRPADVRLHADWTSRATRIATKGWSDGS